MKLVIMVQDNRVKVDNYGLKIDLTQFNHLISDMESLHWSGAKGEKIKLDGWPEALENIDVFQPIIDEHARIKHELENPVYSFEDKQLMKLNEINDEAEFVLAQLKASYPQSEIDTWTRQALEARAYDADNSAATPLLDGIASSRGIDRVELIGRAKAKADASDAILMATIGKRQKLVDEIDAATVESELDVIGW